METHSPYNIKTEGRGSVISSVNAISQLLSIDDSFLSIQGLKKGKNHYCIVYFVNSVLQNFSAVSELCIINWHIYSFFHKQSWVLNNQVDIRST